MCMCVVVYIVEIQNSTYEDLPEVSKPLMVVRLDFRVKVKVSILSTHCTVD